MKDLQNFDAKLQQQKEQNAQQDVLIAEKEKRENRRAPHLTNLNEDPQLSQHVYYGMTSFPVTVGRKNEDPPPNIIFGGVSVRKNHAQFVMLPNGLIRLEVNQDQKALAGTLVNGRPLKDGLNIQVLGHLDTVYFGPGQMLLFKYPLQKRKYDQLFAAIQKETEAEDLAEEVQQAKAWELLNEVGVTTDLENVVCEDYTEDEIK